MLTRIEAGKELSSILEDVRRTVLRVCQLYCTVDLVMCFARRCLNFACQWTRGIQAALVEIT